MPPKFRRFPMLGILLPGILLASEVPQPKLKSRPQYDRDEVYSALTAVSWTGAGGNSRLNFSRNGTYYWLELPGGLCGTPNLERSGSWYFTLSENNAGTIILDAGDLMRFNISPPAAGRSDSLRILGRVLVPDSSSAPTADSLPSDSRRLPPLFPDPFVGQLTAEEWRKLDDFNLGMDAERLRFRSDGTYHASYRNGQCDHDGEWSLFVTASGNEMWSMSAINRCDTRDSGHAYPMAVNERPSIHDGVLRIHRGLYCPTSDTTSLRSFSFDNYGSSLSTQGSYHGNFAMGRATRITLRFVDADDRRPKTLTSLKVSLQRTVRNPIGGGYSLVEPVSVLVNHKFHEFGPESRAPREYTFELVPRWRGELSLKFQVCYLDEGQTYDGRQSYLLTAE